VVDGRPYESAQPSLTGLQIKAAAGLDVGLGLFLEGHGKGSDRQIGDGEVVDLSAPGHDQFYSAPPANYGVGPTLGTDVPGARGAQCGIGLHGR
jgi:hypothetical protein